MLLSEADEHATFVNDKRCQRRELATADAARLGRPRGSTGRTRSAWPKAAKQRLQPAGRSLRATAVAA